MSRRGLIAKLEYKGTPFLGWQIQKHGPTVQSVLESALGQILQCPTPVVSCSRTDAGVHAKGQVIRFEVDPAVDLPRLFKSINAVTPPEISLQQLVVAPPGFHPRFHALGKRYSYQIQQTPYPPALERDVVWWAYAPWNWERITQASNALLGTHDFSAFRGGGCSAPDPIKTLYHIDFAFTPLNQGQRVKIWFYGSGFLKYQIRLMVGALSKVGQGKIPPESISQALAQGVAPFGFKAPAQGLCLEEILYSPDPFAPANTP